MSNLSEENNIDKINKNENDSLKELKELLKKDAETSSDDTEQLIPASAKTSAIIRLSVIVVASAILYFTGIFDNLAVVLTAIFIFIAIEALNIYSIIKAKKKEQKGSYFPSTKKKSKN